jgi:hypothetical protein
MTTLLGGSLIRPTGTPLTVMGAKPVYTMKGRPVISWERS